MSCEIQEPSSAVNDIDPKDADAMKRAEAAMKEFVKHMNGHKRSTDGWEVGLRPLRATLVWACILHRYTHTKRDAHVHVGKMINVPGSFWGGAHNRYRMISNQICE